MIKSFIALVSFFSVLVPSVASAQSPEAQRAVEFCEARYSGSTSYVRLQQLLCIQDQNIRILESRLLKGEGSFGAELARLRKELEATKAELARVRDAPASAPSGDRSDTSVADALAANERRVAEIRARVRSTPSTGSGSKTGPPPPAAAPRVQAPLSTPPPPPPPVVAPRVAQPSVGYVGTPFTVVSVPGQYAASTFEPEMDRLKITGLSLGVQQHVRGARQVRILVKRGSGYLPIGHDQPRLLCGQQTPWNEIYADLNRDGRPDRSAYKAVDPAEVDSLYISNVRGFRDLELVYLVPTGKAVLVPGCEPQIVWGYPTRVQMGGVSSGSWRKPAVAGRKL